MRYSFGDYILDSKLEVLLADGNRLDIEPKQYSTLLLLCQQKNEIVSREQLLADIWNGIIVSENTINKHIAGLRKLLGDSAKSPKYIETVPKKGYRFIGNPELLTEPEPAKKSGEATLISNEAQLPLSNNRLVASVAFGLMLVVTVLIYWGVRDTLKVENIKTLTRMEGDKWSISLYKDDVNIVFINQKPDASELIIQNILDHTSHKVEHEFDFISLVAGATGEKQLYLVGRKADKAWLTRGSIVSGRYIIDSQLDVSNRRLLDIDYKPEHSTLYLVAQSSSTNDRGLYEVDAQFNSLEPIYIPDNDNVLISRVDSDPNKDKLLLLEQRPNSQSTLVSFEPATKAINTLHEFDSLIRDAIWHEDAILYTDTPPAQRVLALQPNTSIAPNVIATSSEYLCCEMLYSTSTQQLVFRTNTTNFHIDWVGNSSWEVDNSTVYDMLPSLLHNNEGVVFVSKRSGKSQIYRQEANSNVTQLSNFSRYHVVRSLDVSPNDERVVAVVDNQLLLLSALGESKPLTASLDSNTWLQDVRWLGNNYIVVSHLTKQSPWLEIYDLELNSIRRLPPQWQQIFADQQDPTSWFALHQSEGLVKLASTAFVKEGVIAIENTIINDVKSKGKILKDGEFFYQQLSREEVIKLNNDNKVLDTYKFKRTYGFDVSESKIIVSDLKYQTSDWHAKQLIGR